MLERLFTHCMIRPADLRPCFEGTQVIGVFNPAAIDTPRGIVLIARVCEAPAERREGWIASPRLEAGRLTIDWFDERDCETSDPRVFRQRTDGCTRLRFISYLKVLHSRDGRTIDGLDGPAILPEGDYETYGIEDPRLTRLGDTWYFTYVAVSRHGVATALMSTTDFRSFRRHGIIFPPENKDVVLFPDKVLGQYVAMHRPVPSMRFMPPEIWLARSPDLIHWGAHAQLVSPDAVFHNHRVGGGTPPLRCEQDYLTLYHGAHREPGGQGAGVYTASALLLDTDNPARVVAWSKQPVMQPEADFEKAGFVDHVVFPTALIARGEEYWVYYGAADECIGVTAFRDRDLLNSLRP